MSRLRRLRRWIGENKPTVIFTAVCAGLLLVLIVVAASNTRHSAPVPVADPVPQTEQIVTAGDLESAEATGEDLRVLVLPVSQYLERIRSAQGRVADAAMNGQSLLTAARITPPGAGGTSLILATRYLEPQTAALLAAYSVADAEVTAVGAPATAGYPGYSPLAPGASRLPAGASTGTGSGGLSLAGMLLIGMVVAAVALLLLQRRRAKAGAEAEAKAEEAALADVPATRFSDVAGCDEAVEDLRELVMLLRQPERFTRVGAHAPSGALLIGPPGTGKTLLARAVAGEAGVPFYPASGSDFVEMYVGVGAKRVRALFAKANKHPEGAIIFIDEIDAVGKKRSSSQNHSNQEHDQTLNALLTEMDGFAGTKVIVLAATNRDDMLDPALVRPGRLDRKVAVPLPDRRGRERILEVHAASKPLAEDVDLTLMAKRTPGMSGAELAQIVNEACMHAAREDREVVTAADFSGALATVAMGRARTSALVSDEDKRLTAWHEAGHAVCGLVQDDGESPTSISIIPRGQAGGVTWFPERDSGYLSRRQAYARLVTGMGGMAAEQMLLGSGEFTSGPSGDLQASTNLALTMVTQLGMGERLIVKSGELLGAAGQGTDEALGEADALMRRALEDAKVLLAGNRALFDAMVDALLEWETLEQSQIDDLVRNRPVRPVTEAPPAPRAEPVAAPAPSAPSPRRRRERMTAREHLAGLAGLASARLLRPREPRRRQGA